MSILIKENNLTYVPGSLTYAPILYDMEGNPIPDQLYTIFRTTGGWQTTTTVVGTGFDVFGPNGSGAANNGTQQAQPLLTPHRQKALHCLGQAAAQKGLSIVLDVAGSLPGFGHLFSGTVEGIQGLNAGYYGVVTLSSAGNTLLNPSASGAAFTGTSAALTVGSLVFQGSKVIPFVGNSVSLGSLAYDATKAVQAYQQCMAGAWIA